MLFFRAWLSTVHNGALIENIKEHQIAGQILVKSFWTAGSDAIRIGRSVVPERHKKWMKVRNVAHDLDLEFNEFLKLQMFLFCITKEFVSGTQWQATEANQHLSHEWMLDSFKLFYPIPHSLVSYRKFWIYWVDVRCHCKFCIYTHPSNSKFTIWH